MSNVSIKSAFERMWHHVVLALNNKSDTDHTHSEFYSKNDKVLRYDEQNLTEEEKTQARTNIGIEETSAMQPDWNQNDSTQPDYVKNRTHWVEGSNTTIEWDGNTEGRDNFTIEETGVTYYKVGDIMPSKNELLGGTMTGFISGNPTEYVLNDDVIWEGDNHLVVADLIVIAYEAGVDFGIPVSAPSTGVYFGLMDGLGYATKLTYGSTTYHPLDEAFIPDTIARIEDVTAPKTELILTSSTSGSTKKFKITIDDEGVLTATEIVESAT